MQVVAMQESDLSSVQEIESMAYAGDLVESFDVLLAKYRLMPELCFVARVDDAVVGYVIAHGWERDTSPGLHKVYEALPDMEVVHIHDMAVNPQFSGRGIARALLAALDAACIEKALPEMTLVAVAGADTFWARMGFSVEKPAQGYDEVAVFMRRYLNP